jgi:hypothetical protein
MKPRPYTDDFPPKLGDIAEERHDLCGIITHIGPEPSYVCELMESEYSVWCGIASHLMLIHRPKQTVVIETKPRKRRKEVPE